MPRGGRWRRSHWCRRGHGAGVAMVPVAMEPRPSGSGSPGRWQVRAALIGPAKHTALGSGIGCSRRWGPPELAAGALRLPAAQTSVPPHRRSAPDPRPEGYARRVAGARSPAPSVESAARRRVRVRIGLRNADRPCQTIQVASVRDPALTSPRDEAATLRPVRDDVLGRAVEVRCTASPRSLGETRPAGRESQRDAEEGADDELAHRLGSGV